MGLFNRKKAAEKTEKVAAAVEGAAAAAGEKIGPAVEKAADAVEAVVTAAGEKAADAIEKAAGAIKDKAAAANETAEEAVEKFAATVDEAVNGGEASGEEAAPAPSCGAAPAPSCGAGSDELTEKEKGSVFACRMNYHAGYGVYKQWPNGGVTIHSGIGWFHPFGPSEYYGVANIPGNFSEESKQFPLEKYFTEDWMKNFETDLFCIYRMPDGDIYAWDGMFAVRGLDPHKCIVYNSEYTRQDVLVNVIVGGTGRYEGVRGLLIGTTEGGGATKVVGKMPDGSDLELPETIMKDLEGYIRFPE